VTGSEAFRELAEAAVGCWIRADVCGDSVSIEEFTREKIRGMADSQSVNV
jgi:hypothetical protein